MGRFSIFGGWKEGPRTRTNPTRTHLFPLVFRFISSCSPDIFTSLLLLTDFLGPTSIGLSIIEGPSNDGTDSLFESVLSPLLVAMGVDPLDLHLNTRRPSANFAKGNRIELLAKLREEAVVPLRRKSGGGKGEKWEASVFFNDVYFSGAMILEMMHQVSGVSFFFGLGFRRSELTVNLGFVARHAGSGHDLRVGSALGERVRRFFLCPSIQSSALVLTVLYLFPVCSYFYVRLSFSSPLLVSSCRNLKP